MSVAEPQPTITVAPSLSARLERLPYTSYQRKIVAILAMCYGLDAVDVSMLSFLLAPISQAFDLTKSMAGLVASAGFIGMGLGATVAGWLADRFGRRRLLISCMFVWGIASLATAFSWNLASFMTFRIITGVGLGAELPVAVAMLAEFVPAKRRARSTGLVQAASSGGQAVFNLISFAAVAVAGVTLGWRAMFVVMFLVAGVALYVRRQLPESPRWYAAAGRHADADATMTEIEAKVQRAYGKPLPRPVEPVLAAAKPRRGSFGQLVARGFLSRTLLAWTLWLVVLLAAYAINTWVGKLLVDRGMTVSTSIMVGVLISLAAVPAGWLTGVFMDKIGRKTIVVVALVLYSLAAFSYGHASSFGWIVAAGALMQFTFFAVGTAFYAYTPELFPTNARATGVGTASTAGRISAIAGPLVVPAVILGVGYTETFIICAGFFLFGAIIVVAFGPETRNKVLEEFSG